jgi:hypothetical protein
VHREALRLVDAARSLFRLGCRLMDVLPPSDSDRAALRISSRRDTSDISFPHFFRKIFRGAPRKRADCQRWILVGVTYKRRCVGHKQILDFMRLAVLIQRTGFRIVAHPDST